MTDETRSEGGPLLTDRRSKFDRSQAGYSEGGSVQVSSLVPDPWAILAGVANADDVERVLVILDELEGGVKQP